MTKKIKKQSDTGRKSGELFVVGTPIGHSSDWTDRSKKILKEADIVAAEDTRVFKREAAKAGVTVKKLVSYHEQNEEASAKGLIDLLKQGNIIALVSDAGTPSISDPGYRIISQAYSEGLKVTPIPGVSSLTCAMSVCALGGRSFHFEGFLPTQSESRKKRMHEIKFSADIIVFFEAPHRVREFFIEAEEAFGPDQPGAVFRELTKPYEEIIHKSVADLKHYFQVNEPRGEFVLMIKGVEPLKLSRDETTVEIDKLLKLGLSASDVLSRIQGLSTLARKELYDLIVGRKKSL